MQLVLDTNGLIVKKRNNAFYIVRKQEKRLISPSRITSIAVTADCLLSSAAIRLAAQHKIPIYFMDGTGQAKARLWSAQFGSIATIRREQTLFALEPEATDWIISLFRLKTQHQIDNLKKLKRRKRKTKVEGQIASTLQKLSASDPQWNPVIARKGKIGESRNTLMGIEGSLARTYWRGVSEVLPEAWKFPSRSRRPAKDPFNAALNYLYGMLYNMVGSAVLAAGLDPHLGFLHVDEYTRPTFVFDFIEPFRPWVDQLLIELILDRKLSSKLFEERQNGIMVNAQGKYILIPAFNKYMESPLRFKGRRLSRKNHIYTVAGEFGQFLLKRNVL